MTTRWYPLTCPKGKEHVSLSSEDVEAIYLAVWIDVPEHVIMKTHGIDWATAVRIYDGEQWWRDE